MKDININYEGLSFEEKISLKINYLLSLPASEAVKSALLNLKWDTRHIDLYTNK